MVDKPVILITNDDGYDSEGIGILRDVALQFGEVWVVAPLKEQSGASHSLTLRKDIEVGKVGERYFWVDGTPADCVLIALYKLLPRKPHLIISGINDGYNLAEDVFYSGTVAGAREGAIYGISSIAISMGNLESGPNWEAARIWSKRVIETLIDIPFKLLNVNIPNLEPDMIKGMKVVRLGSRKYVEPVKVDGNGKFRIGGEPKPIITDDTDIGAVKEGFVSITPLLIDITDYREMDSLKEYLAGYKKV